MTLEHYYIFTMYKQKITIFMAVPNHDTVFMSHGSATS